MLGFARQAFECAAKRPHRIESAVDPEKSTPCGAQLILTMTRFGAKSA